MNIYAVLLPSFMENGSKMNCRICGRKSCVQIECKDCRHFLKNGVDEHAIRRMHSDGKTKKIWIENEYIAESLAQAYYEFVLDDYNKKIVRKDTKENFGYNTFVDGIRCGIDIIIPMLDDEMQSKVKDKIKHMISIRKNVN